MFVIFDYDGVIIDSLPPVHKAATALHVHLGQDGTTLAKSREWVGPSIADSVRRVRRELNVDDSRQEELEQYFFDAYVRAAPTLTRTIDGMLNLLSDLAAKGTPRALATMKAQTEMNAMSTRLPGLEYFDFIASPPTHLGGTSKKDLVGRAVEHVLEIAPAESHGVMIGDRSSDIHAGQAHGLETVAVTWGAGTPHELAAAHPDHTLDSVPELRRLLGV